MLTPLHLNLTFLLCLKPPWPNENSQGNCEKMYSYCATAIWYRSVIKANAQKIELICIHTHLKLSSELISSEESPSSSENIHVFLFFEIIESWQFTVESSKLQ